MARRLLRQFCSSSHSGATRALLLDNALNHVPEFGWSKQAIAAGALDAGLPPVSHTILSRGGFDLLLHHQVSGNHKLRDYLEQLTAPRDQPPTEAASPESVIVAGIRHRLEHTLPMARCWPEAMALGAQPEHISETIEALAVVADDLCYYAGDRSTDSHWYTRRAAIGAVYVSAELYMLTDYSDGNQDLWDFVQRSVGEAARVEAQLGQAGEIASVLDKSIGTLAGAAASILRPHNNSKQGLRMPSALSDSMTTEMLGQTIRTAVDLARDPSNGLRVARSVFSNLSSAVNINGATATNPTPGSAAASNAAASEENHQMSPTSPSFSSQNIAQFDEGAMDELRLPEGLSLWGLLSMNVHEAELMIQKSNPSFRVLRIPAGTAFKAIESSAIVRLFYDCNDVIVNVDRGEGEGAADM